MTGSSNSQPNALQAIGRQIQVRWNIERKDITTEDGKIVENWNYDYTNVNSQDLAAIVAGVIRSRYTQDEAEAILANYAQRKDISEYLKFQEWRNLAKSVASGKTLKADLIEHYERQLIRIKMPLSFALSGGKYEVLADRVMKLMCPYEITVENGIEMVTTWLGYIEPEHQHIQTDPELEIGIIKPLNEEV